MFLGGKPAGHISHQTTGQELGGWKTAKTGFSEGINHNEISPRKRSKGNQSSLKIRDHNAKKILIKILQA